MYADDIVLYNTMSNMESLKNDMSKTARWCKGNKLTMNLVKTKYQIFPQNTHMDIQLEIKRFSARNWSIMRWIVYGY